jgi:zinc/manganese transport system permease protein
MTDAISLLWPPLLVALCLIGIHTYFGIQVLARKVIFVDLALAQIAALGATVAFMLGHPAQSLAAYGYSFAFTLLAALILAFTRAWSERVPQEALIGVIYVVAAGAAIVLIDRAPQGAEHLKQILTGNILTSSAGDLFALVPLYTALGLLHLALRHRLAGGDGQSWLWEFVFYATFGVVVTSSVALAGVLLVFSFLIIPAAIGMLYADNLARQLALGWAVGAGTSVAGLAISYAFDLPTGAAMVCTFGAALALAGILRPFIRRGIAEAGRRAILVMRWGAAALLTASALQLMITPRADQPLLDAIEYVIPALRANYLNVAERTTYEDARQYADRYIREAEQLNALEMRSRAEGEMLDDMMVQRISSFLKSYGEMQRGEEFVMQEVRARARERIRWLLGVLALLVAVAITPGLTRRLRRVMFLRSWARRFSFRRIHGM